MLVHFIFFHFQLPPFVVFTVPVFFSMISPLKVEQESSAKDSSVHKTKGSKKDLEDPKSSEYCIKWSTTRVKTVMI